MRPDYCPIGNQPCQSLCDTPCTAQFFVYRAKEALAQPAQEPVAYDKTEMNGFVQDLYDKKMQEGKHGHYETMFHVVHQAIKRATPPQRTVQVSPLEFVEMVMDKEHLVGNPIVWAQWPNKEKNT